MGHLADPYRAGTTLPHGTGGNPEAGAHLPQVTQPVGGGDRMLPQGGPYMHLRDETGYQLAPLAGMLGDYKWMVQRWMNVSCCCCCCCCCCCYYY